MNYKEIIGDLIAKKDNPSVSIIMETHRTYPDIRKDEIMLKNLISDAQKQLEESYDKKEVSKLLEKLGKVQENIDFNYLLDTLHIFVSNNTYEVFKTASKTKESKVYIDDHFAVKNLIKSYTRTKDYYIMVLSQSGVKLYEATNDGITEEIENNNFPFDENPLYLENHTQRSDSKREDKLVREYFNQVDKAFQEVHNQNSKPCVLICTENNYSFMNQVADQPQLYIGYANIDYNNTKPYHIAEQAWEVMSENLKKERTEAVGELKKAVAESDVLTDLNEIYRASIDGRGDLLVVDTKFKQSVKFTDERNFDIVDESGANVEDDTTGKIAWEVLSKDGRVVFVNTEEKDSLAPIALKVRY